MQSETVLDNPQVQNEMKPGEHLLWWGKPNLAHRVKSRIFYLNPIIMGVLAVFTLVLIYNAWNLLIEEIGFYGSFQSTSLSLFVFCVFLFLFCLARILLFYYQIQKNFANLRNTTYAITDRRIIVITATSKSLAVKSHTRGDIGQIVRSETGGGWGDVSYGIPRSQQAGFRSVTVVDKLAGVPNAGMVEDILMRTFKNSQPVPQQGWYPSYPQQQPYLSQPQYDAQPVQYPPSPQYYAQPPAPQPTQGVPPMLPRLPEQPAPEDDSPQEEQKL
jgi:hypothetical protein